MSLCPLRPSSFPSVRPNFPVFSEKISRIIRSKACISSVFVYISLHPGKIKQHWISSSFTFLARTHPAVTHDLPPPLTSLLWFAFCFFFILLKLSKAGDGIREAESFTLFFSHNKIHIHEERPRSVQLRLKLNLHPLKKCRLFLREQLTRPRLSTWHFFFDTA